MIGITSPTFDLEGAVLINEHPQSLFPVTSRRLTRTPTLDGNSTINDMGFSHGDDVYQIEFVWHQDRMATLKHLIQTYPELILSSKDGVFSGAIRTMTPAVEGGRARFTFLVKEKLSA